MSNTRSLGVLIWGIASSLGFHITQLPAQTQVVTGNATLPKAKASKILPALPVPAWALSKAQAKCWKGRAIKQCLPSVLHDSGSREM